MPVMPAPPGGPFAPPLGSVARGVRQRTSQMNGHPRFRAGQNPAYRPSGAALKRGTVFHILCLLHI